MLMINYKILSLGLWLIGSCCAMEHQPKENINEQEENTLEIELKNSEELFKRIINLSQDMCDEILKSFIGTYIKNSTSLKDIRNLEKISKNVRNMLYSQYFNNLIVKKRTEILQDLQKKLDAANIEVDITKDINNTDTNRLMLYTALMQAAKKGNENITKDLINAGANINLQDINLGINALMWAVSNGHTKIVKLLINHGADVNLKTRYCWTALMAAATVNKPKIVRLLIINGAKINSKNNDGETALMLAEKKGSWDIVKLINPDSQTLV